MMIIQLFAGGPDSDTPESELTKAARSTWARLIKKVYEVDPLICPHCGGQMRFLAVIEGSPGDRADPGSDRGVVPLTTIQSTAR